MASFKGEIKTEKKKLNLNSLEIKVTKIANQSVKEVSEKPNLKGASCF